MKIIDNKSGDTIDAELSTNELDDILTKVDGEGTSTNAWLDDKYETNIGRIEIRNCHISSNGKEFFVDFIVYPPFRGELAQWIDELGEI